MRRLSKHVASEPSLVHCDIMFKTVFHRVIPDTIRPLQLVSVVKFLMFILSRTKFESILLLSENLAKEKLVCSFFWNVYSSSHHCYPFFKVILKFYCAEKAAPMLATISYFVFFSSNLDSVLCITGVLMFKTSLFLSPQVLAIVIRSHIFHMHLVTFLLKDKIIHYSI